MALSGDEMSQDSTLEIVKEEDKSIIEEKKDEVDLSSSDDEQQEIEITKLEKLLEENPYEYNGYLSLIGQYRNMGELEKLRNTRENMSKHFPLTPELWMLWIEDEKKLCETEEEKDAVAQLFERAIKDYISVELWVEYVQFNIRLVARDNGIEDVRALFERSLESAGHHVTQGHLLWETYREFEMAMLNTMKLEQESSPTKDRAEVISALRERVTELLARQLVVPLAGMDYTLREWQAWLVDNPQVQVEDQADTEDKHDRAQDVADTLTVYESKLAECDPSRRAEVFYEYLAHVTHSPAVPPQTVLTLHERAVAECCLDSRLWADYARYLGREAPPLIDRALRNCPWCGELWVLKLRGLEQAGKPASAMEEMLEQALSCGLSSAEDYCTLWMAYLEYQRRLLPSPGLGDATRTQAGLDTIRSTFRRAMHHLSDNFGPDGDPTCMVPQFWARMELLYDRNLGRFRKLWDDVMGLGHAKSAAMWLEYISWERIYGEPGSVRSLYEQALRDVRDWPESVAQAWLNYERDVGDLASYEACLAKYRTRIAKVMKQRAKQAAKEAEQEKAERRHVQRNRDRGKEQDSRHHGKRKQRENEGKWAGMAAKSTVSKREAGEAPRKKAKREAPVAATVPKPAVHDPAMDEYTVFLSNLDYLVEEGPIKELFGQAAEVQQVRMARDFKGRSKGFAYVVYKSKADVDAALKLDRRLLAGRPVYVSRCEPDKQQRQHGFKFATGQMERNKLFVKGLPFTTTREDLETLFKPFGALKDVRLVTFRNGQSKGMAYVDFEDDAAAAAAVEKTNGMTLQDKTLVVAISNPPAKRDPGSLIPATLGAPKPPTKGRARLQISLVPRAVQRTKAVPDEEPKVPDEEPKVPVVNGNEEKARTNEDFRQMLLGKK